MKDAQNKSMGNPHDLPHRVDPFSNTSTDTNHDESVQAPPSYVIHHELVQAPPSYVISGQIILIGLLICSSLFLLLFIIYSYLRHRQRRRRLADWRQPRLFFSNRAEPSPRCLDQNIIDSIPVIKLSLHGDDEVTESCAVCISEFTHGETLRALPQCGHRFHLECIDMWFASHSTCPLCRADVNSSSPNLDQQVQLGEMENKELCTVHRSPLDGIV